MKLSQKVRHHIFFRRRNVSDVYMLNVYRLLTSCSHHSVKTFWTRCSGRRLSREGDAGNTSEFYHTLYLLLSMSVSLLCDDDDDESCCPRGLVLASRIDTRGHLWRSWSWPWHLRSWPWPWPWSWKKSLGLSIGKANTFLPRSWLHGCCMCMLCSHSRCHMTICHFLLRNVSQTCMYVRCRL